MTRTIEQILADERIELSPRLIRTPGNTIEVEAGWILGQHDWQPISWPSSYDWPSPVAVAALVASVWLLARPIPPDMPWLIPVAFGTAIGATWSIGRSLLTRWLTPTYPTQPRYALTFGGWPEAPVTIFQSDDEQEIKLLRQKLETMLLPHA